MKKLFLILAVAALALAMNTGIASAYSVSYGGILGEGGYTSAVATATVETFDSASLAWNWTPDANYNIVTGFSSGAYAAPAYVDAGNVTRSDLTKYISVPKAGSSINASTNFVKATSLGGTYNYFGIWWGSMDTYNTLKFYNGLELVATITGSDLAKPANGDQFTPGTNRYVNFDFGSLKFDSFEMTSTQFAFEADNIAVGNVVPEPGTMLLFGAGLLGLAIYGKRRLNKES